MVVEGPGNPESGPARAEALTALTASTAVTALTAVITVTTPTAVTVTTAKVVGGPGYVCVGVKRLV